MAGGIRSRSPLLLDSGALAWIRGSFIFLGRFSRPKARPEPLMGSRQARANRADRYAEGCRRFRIRQPRPIAKGDDLLVATAETRQFKSNSGHCVLIVKAVNDIISLIRNRRPRRRRQPSVASSASCCVARYVLRDAEQPWQSGVSVEADGVPASPRFKEDRTHQVFRDVPGSGPAKAIIVDCIGMALEDQAKRGDLSAASELPQLLVSARVFSHTQLCPDRGYRFPCSAGPGGGRPSGCTAARRAATTVIPAPAG